MHYYQQGGVDYMTGQMEDNVMIFDPFKLFVGGAAVAEWLSSWLAEQEDRGSIPGLATLIFRDWLSPSSKSRYGWNTAESDVNPQYNQPTNNCLSGLQPYDTRSLPDKQTTAYSRGCH